MNVSGNHNGYEGNLCVFNLIFMFKIEIFLIVDNLIVRYPYFPSYGGILWYIQFMFHQKLYFDLFFPN
ncbi:hypothetical protein DLD82_12250 [Methanospirillum stamsii]|uniref:Uncharacterized protein n=1 Tax=Methanospirillum stamsii TaxID=1277351 RepID=A0A2V2N7Y5_9EURY|nr:hypothetical protein DLD82_12250 [Methanospirillum stamsii]